MAGQITNLSDATYESFVFDSDTPVVIDFWATWCGPCKQLNPVLEKLAGDFDGKVKVGKVNIEECPQVTVAAGVMGVPLLLAYKNGELVGRQQGFAGAAGVEKFFKSLL